MSYWHAGWRQTAGAAAVGCKGADWSFVAWVVAQVAGLDAGTSQGADVSGVDRETSTAHD